MAKLIVLSGYSGSGKSTLADSLHANLEHGFILRSDTYYHCYRPGQDVTQFLIELAVTHVRHGVNVIVDAVNKHPADRKRWEKAAGSAACTFEWRDMGTPIDVCIARDAMRRQPVGAAAILSQMIK